MWVCLFLAAGSLFASECPAGKFQEFKSSACASCPSGKYTSATAQKVCLRAACTDGEEFVDKGTAYERGATMLGSLGTGELKAWSGGVLSTADGQNKGKIYGVSYRVGSLPLPCF